MAWSDLPIDLLRRISSQLSIVELVRLSLVCTSWNFTPTNCALLRFQCRPSPWLLLSNDVNEASGTLTFRELTIEGEEAIISFQRRFSSITYNTYGRRCFGSKDGWLVTLDKIELQPRLFNPITKANILLPSLYDFIMPQFASDGFIRNSCNEILLDIMSDDLRDIYFHKFIFSSNNASGTVVVIYGIKKALALARSEDLTWVLGPQLSFYSTKDDEQFEDVCYHEENERFYAITNFSMVLAFDLNGENVELICPNRPNNYYHTINFDYMYYIAFLSGTLIRIERVIDITHNRHHNATTMAIFVFKFVPSVVTSSSSSYSQWIPINELGEYSIFVGCNQTFSLDHTVATGIKPNCIYFSDHWSNMLLGNVDCDVGLCDLHNDRIQYILHPNPRTNWPPSIWFTPSFSYIEYLSFC
ncbi:putative F-box protein At4g17565 [Dendrobium catenatum]|uniref:putative F-box protein At4g17565 n=1 Tax=Dendrobium catenatum TaxID=906689 RepID=UPI0009F4CFAC|nr:putative F-box protein At4g17565 [Dendrobium catenatum]